MQTLTLIFAGLFGLVFGSFFNVCIYRIPRKKSIAWPSSFCPQCRKPIRWFDNIPVLSYLCLRGKCRHCKGKISVQYPAVELLTALATVLFVYRYGLTLWTGVVLTAIYFLITLRGFGGKKNWHPFWAPEWAFLGYWLLPY